MTARATSLWRDPLLWCGVGWVALVLLMGRAKPLFALIFPSLARPLYALDSFPALAIGHLALVGASSGIAAIVGVAAGIFVTRAAGAEFRQMVEVIATIGQTFPPVAVLAVAVPLIGFGFEPALIALALYGLLPVVENTISGIGTVPAGAREAARGIGMGEAAILWQIELPLAAPVIIAGIRVSTIINIGTAAIASTVGARTLGSPIIIGLNGANIAYVLQGAVLVGLLAVVVDLGFGRVQRMLERWRRA